MCELNIEEEEEPLDGKHGSLHCFYDALGNRYHPDNEEGIVLNFQYNALDEGL